MTQIVILAAGKGTRMRSSKPKVLHTLAGKPFLHQVIDTSLKLAANKIIVVVGHGAEQVKACTKSENVVFVEQTEQLGTGHAVAQALPEIDDNEQVLILYGDVPLISESTLVSLQSLVDGNAMGLLTFTMQNPTGYGRIIRNGNQCAAAIVEQKDASPSQLEIKEVNTGVMAVNSKHLKSWLPKLSNKNAQGEYYLTDIVAMADAEGIQVKICQPEREMEITGVNNRIQQANLERDYQAYQAEQLMHAGLTLLDPSRFDLRGELTHGEDCEIDINCIFEGKVRIGNNVKIGANSIIKDAKIGDNTVILPNTSIDSSTVGKDCNIGPYARLRPGSNLADQAKIGNFVETKKANIGLGSKVNHLSYIGDAEVGEHVNIGAGTITCNYDGVNKSTTTIKDGAFIGSNSALVAPVTIGKNGTVGAGTVMTRSSDEAQLTVARAKQRNVDGWERPTKRK